MFSWMGSQPNAVEGWANATSEVYRALARRVADEHLELSAAIEAFVDGNATTPMQLPLPLKPAY
jgi:hypothetical protein